MILPTNRQGEWDIRAESSLLGKEIRGTGQTSFMERAANASYSKEFKVNCVLTALRGEGSVDEHRSEVQHFKPFRSPALD